MIVVTIALIFHAAAIWAAAWGAAWGAVWAKTATGLASRTAAATVDRRKRVIALFSRSIIVAGCAGTAVPTIDIQLFWAFVQLGRPERHT